MININLLAIALSSLAIGCLLADGVVGNEPMWIAGNCMLIGINWGLWRSK